jgi:hypothetical protein
MQQDQLHSIWISELKLLQTLDLYRRKSSCFTKNVRGERARMTDDRDIPSPPPDFSDRLLFPPAPASEDQLAAFPAVPDAELDLPLPKKTSSKDTAGTASFGANVSVNDLEERLMKLNPSTAYSSKMVKLSDIAKNEPEVSKSEQADRLFRQLADEARIEKKHNVDDDDEIPTVPSFDDDNGDDDPVVVKSLLKQARKEEKASRSTSAPAADDPQSLLDAARRHLQSSDKDRMQDAATKSSSNERKGNANIARALLREAEESGIDPKSLDIRKLAYLSDNDDTDTDDDDVDSDTLSDDDDSLGSDKSSE